MTTTQEGFSVSRSVDKVRSLTAEELGVAPEVTDVGDERTPDVLDAPNAGIEPEWDEEAFIGRILSLLTEYGGVILTGPPGTSKSYYANKVADRLTDGDPNRTTFVQFHPSYQYEDFMQGYLPDPNTGGFTLRNRHLVAQAKKAANDSSRTYVMVVDEISRADPARVFGEALTYVEKSKRGLPFSLSSGDVIQIPDNLYIVATMNPFDRGVDDVDAAFERRFAKVRMEPSEPILRRFLAANGMPFDRAEGVVTFFKRLQAESQTTPAAALGHTFFMNVSDLTSLEMLWEHQLSFFVERAFPLDLQTRRGIEGLWAQQVTSSRHQIVDAQWPQQETELGSPNASDPS
jgi:5-methylcytosine-specific restriction protein B